MTKKNSSSRKTVKKTISINYSLKERKVARDLAIAELINSLKKLKVDKSLRFGNLGTFEKTQHKIKSRFNNKSKGKTYLYYRINFRASSHLKRELDK